MATNSANTSSAKPSISGAVWRAPKGTTLPTDATTSLNQSFKSLGYLGNSGLVHNQSRSFQNTTAWGGDVVDSSQNEKNDTFAIELLEILNVDVLKTVKGDANVTGTLTSGIVVTETSEELQDAVYVIEMVMKGGVLKRVVIPEGKITEVGETTYNDGDSAKYPITITALPHSGYNGATHKEYIKAPTTSA